jgi:hypothetical protein
MGIMAGDSCIGLSRWPWVPGIFAGKHPDIWRQVWHLSIFWRILHGVLDPSDPAEDLLPEENLKHSLFPLMVWSGDGSFLFHNFAG